MVEETTNRLSKFKVGDHVRVTAPGNWFDTGCPIERVCQDWAGVRIGAYLWWFKQKDLTLADPERKETP